MKIKPKLRMGSLKTTKSKERKVTNKITSIPNNSPSIKQISQRM